ncbi:MAG: ATP-binding protein [Syntrophobacteraceae bacterium]
MREFFSRTEITTVLNGFNPWWGNRTCDLPNFRRLAFDACKMYLKDKSLKRAILLSGPRRVGKTTILQQMAIDFIQEGDNPRSILYLSLDHPLLKLLSLSEILSFYHESVHPEDREALLLLDEVQYSKDWETEVKLLIDHKPNYRILATGSASVVHRDRLAESGVGRWITVPIPTLSFYEFAHLRQERLPKIPPDLRVSDLFSRSPGDLMLLASKMRPLLPLFQLYLLVGGFPETARQANIDLCRRLLREDVVERVLKRDMTALFGVRNINDLEKLFIYLCIHTGSIVGHNTCAKELGTSATTVANHLVFMEQANLIYRLPPSDVSGKRMLKARNKYYLVDAALRNAVLLKGEEILTNSDEMGRIVETTVLRHLYAYHYRDMPEIVYWRDSIINKEVDIIVKSPAYILPFEIKYKEDAAIGKNDGLYIYCNTAKVKLAYLVTKRDSDFGLEDLGDTTRML